MIVTRGWGVGKKGDLKHRKESKENVSKGNKVIKIKNNCHFSNATQFLLKTISMLFIFY